MNWDDFRLVRAIAEARSLVGAADSLDLNHSTVFRRLGQIEAELGRSLFERSRSGYAPTEAGAEMIDLANSMADGVLAFERRIAGKDERPRGLLRLTTTDSLYGCLLAPILATFLDAYPDIRLELVISSAALNLARRDADIALRASADPDETLVGRKVAPLGFGVYAAANSRYARIDPMGEEARFIGFLPPIDESEAGRWLDANVSAARIASRVNTMMVAAHSAAAGLGFAVLPCVIGEHTPGLVRRAPAPSSAALWLLTHADLKNAARVRAFMDHAWAHLSKQRALIAGEQADPS